MLLAVLAMVSTSMVFASHVVAGISIPNVHESDFQAPYPSPAIAAIGALLPFPGPYDPLSSDDTLWTTANGTVARLQSAVYAGTGLDEGLYAYVYQVDCTGGIVLPLDLKIPLSGAVLHPTGGSLGSMFTYIATQFDPLQDFEPLPATLFTGNLTPFNLSEFGGSFGIGGNTAAGWTHASLGVDEVLAGSTTDNFWSGTLLVFVTDVPPVIGHVTVTTGVGGGSSNLVAALIPSPGVGDPDVPPGDIITDPPEVVPVTEVHVDIKPGSDPNSVNTKSKGQLPIGVYGSSTFDVRDIVLSSIIIECMGITASGKFAYEDLVMQDGIEDLMIHVPMQAFPWGAPKGTEVTITVTGMYNDGSGLKAFFGEDVVLIRK